MGSKPSKAAESSTASKDAKPSPASSAKDSKDAKPRKGCCGCSAAPAEEWGMIPTQQRKCRDSLCCLLFLIFWAGMIVVGAFGIYFGNPARLLYGTDYLGQTCGSSAAVKDSKYIVYPRVNEDFLANSYKSSPLDYTFYGICQSSCPAALEVICNYDNEAVSWTSAQRTNCWGRYDTVDSKDCKIVTNGKCWINPMVTSSVMFRCIPDYNVTGASSTACVFPTYVSAASDPRCVVKQVDTMGSTQSSAQPNYLFDQLNTTRSLWGRIFGDLSRAWWVILLCGIGVAALVALLYVQFLKVFTGCMVWTTIFLVVLSLSGMTVWFYYKAGLVTLTVSASLSDKFAAATGVNLNTTVAGVVSKANGLVSQSLSSSDATIDQYKIIAYVSTGVLVIVISIVAAMLRSIAIAIQVIKIGCRALQALPELILFPVTNVLAIGVFLIWWVFVAASLQSAGTVSTTDLTESVKAGMSKLSVSDTVLSNLTSSFLNSTTTMSTVSELSYMNYLQIYHVFGLLWTLNFVEGVAAMTVAGSVCAWYFGQLPKELEGAEEYEKLRFPKTRCVSCASLWRTLRFHAGSVAFGSLLISIIQFIRLIFLYIQRQMEAGGNSNILLRYIFCLIQACLKCLQSLVEAVTTNAYIFVALKGKSFCASGLMVFKLIVNHGSVFAAVNVLGSVIVFLGKIIISVASAAAAYLIIERTAEFQATGANALTSSWLPIIVVLIFAYVTSSMFMSVFDLSVDSVLVCYCTDVEENQARHGGDSKFKTSIHMSSTAFDAKQAADDKAAKDAAAGKKGDDSKVAPSEVKVGSGSAPKV